MRAETTRDSSRDTTNRLLGALRARRWGPRAWGPFLTDASTRSLEQARRRPRALAEVSVLHGFMLLAGRRSAGPGVRWVMTSWTLAALHLGRLESRTTLGAANTLTLVRATLPVTGDLLGRWIGVVAMSTDFVDGRLARHTGTTTPFGLYSDALADTAFWFWFATTRCGRNARIAVILTWLLPAASVTARSFLHGEMVDPPRPRWIRPAAALQVALATAAVIRDKPHDQAD